MHIALILKPAKLSYIAFPDVVFHLVHHIKPETDGRDPADESEKETVRMIFS